MVVFIGGASAKLLGTVAFDHTAGFSPVNDGGGQAGELMVILATAIDFLGNLDRNVPSGWADFFDGLTTIGSNTSGECILYKKLGGGETGDIAPFTGDSLTYSGIAQRFRWPGTPTHGGTAFQITTGNPSAQVKSVSALAGPLLILATGVPDDTLSFSVSETYDSGDIGNFRVKHLLHNGTALGSDVTIDKDDDGANRLGSGYLANS